MQHSSRRETLRVRDYAEPLPKALDRRNGARLSDWIVAGALMALGLLVFGGAIWTVFVEMAAP